MAQRRATIIDVAERAGVSWKTVSRVVNGEGPVRPETAERVRAAIAALGFKPNSAARALAGSQSFLIAAIADNPSAHYVFEFHQGAARACRERGYQLTIESIRLGDPAAVGQLERDLDQFRFDGLILTPPVTDDDRILDALDRRDVRYVRLAPANASGRSDAIFTDDAAGVTALAEHLWSLGHRAFGIVTGPPEHGASQLRLQAFADTIGRLGEGKAGIAVAEGDFTFDTGRRRGAELLAARRRPTAIFASNDEAAAGVIAAAGARGLGVPEDLSVAGFDDGDVARMIWPPLTTVRQPIGECARLAVELLTERNRSAAPVMRTRPVELIVRQSTGKAKAGWLRR